MENNIRLLIRYFKFSHVLISDPYSLFSAEFDELNSWFTIYKEENYAQKQANAGEGRRYVVGQNG